MAAQRSVLIVEDDSNTRRVLALLLELRGYEVVEAEDGRSALDVAHDVDVVVSDLQLPRMSGIAFARALRDQDEDMPVIAITSGPKALVSEAEECRLFSQVLRKPVDVNEFLELVDDLSRPRPRGPGSR